MTDRSGKECPGSGAQESPRWTVFDIEQVEEVTIVRFKPRTFLDGPEADSVADQLLELVIGSGRCRLVLNCRGLESLNSSMLGKLITVHKKALPLGGRLALCNLQPGVRQVFETVKLSVLIGFYDSESEAVYSFRSI